MGYFLFKIKLLYIIPPRIIVIAPAIIGNRRNGNETPPIITAIGLPPAGGCVTLKAIISIIAIPTAKPIVMKETSKNVTKITPTNAVKRCPKKMFLG